MTYRSQLFPANFNTWTGTFTATAGAMTRSREAFLSEYNRVRDEDQRYHAMMQERTRDFVTNDERRMRQQTTKYAMLTAAAVGSLGLGLLSWQSTPKDERTKAAQFDAPDTPRAEQVKSKAQSVADITPVQP